MPLTSFTPNTKAKSSEVNSNFSGLADGTLIADSAILPKHLLTGTGSTHVWASITPTFTNLTVGNGTLTGYWIQIGKTVFYRGSIVFGSTSSMGSLPYVTLPVNAVSTYPTQPTTVGRSWLEDSGVANYSGEMVIMGSNLTRSQVLVNVASGTYLTNAGLTSTTPFTWGTSDGFCWFIIYEAA